MKVIDFETKGNVVRFYLGDDNCDDYWGDDWNDTPYEHNAGTVYERFTKGWIDCAFPFDDWVLEPRDDWRNEGNSRYCKEDMKNRAVPCIIIVPHSLLEEYYDEGFNFWLGFDDVERVYFGDSVEKIESLDKVHIHYQSGGIDYGE